MSLQVQKISNNESYKSRQKNASTGGNTNHAISMQARTAPAKIIDESNDGKFSFWQATKNFGKGLISPVTTLFESKKNFIMGAGMIAASVALVVATGGAAAPLLVGVGVAMGAVQGAKGIYKMAKAKNGDDVEKAFYDVGGATGTIGLSLVGAKSSLKQAGIDSAGLNTLSATGKCLTSTKAMAAESFGVFKSGYFKTNISNFYKSITTPKSLKKYSKELYEYGNEKAAETFGMFEKLLPKQFKSKFTCRNKCEISIYEKMVKEMTTIIDEQIKDIKTDKLYTPEVKKLKIAELEKERLAIKNDPAVAKSKVEDLFGARITPDSPEELAVLAEFLSKNAKKGNFKIKEAENYRGQNSKFNGENEYYFTKEQVQQMKESTKSECRIKFREKKSGYTGTNFKIEMPNGEVIELQVSLSKVRKIGDFEHAPYDLSVGKDLAKGNNQIGIIYSSIQNAIKKLKPKQQEIYQEYYYDKFINAQAQEYGKPYKATNLPDGIPQVLSTESTESIMAVADKIPHGAKKVTQNGLAQLPSIYGAYGLLRNENN